MYPFNQNNSIAEKYILSYLLLVFYININKLYSFQNKIILVFTILVKYLHYHFIIFYTSFTI